MRVGEPRFCIACGINRRAERGGTHCWACMPGGPFTPPPCTRCATTADFFASGLCRRCHLYGDPGVDSCLDCFAWGAARTHKWLCHPCVAWQANYPIGDCRACGRHLAVGTHRVCRLCRKQATSAHGRLDVVAANRHGQQLFLANMAKKTIGPAPTPAPDVVPPRPARPVTHRQLLLFDAPRNLTGGRGSVGPPRDPELAAWLDACTTSIAATNDWDWRLTTKVRAGIRILLALQDTPGAAIARSELDVLPRFFAPKRQTAAVLDAAGMLDDDRIPTIERKFNQEVTGLPPAMKTELREWFDVMRNGSTTSPRRRPRSDTTIAIYLRAVLPTARRWAEDGHHSLREITRTHILAALHTEPTRRRIIGQAMRSVFGILKARKLVFANPAVRLAHAAGDQAMPPPAVDLDAIRTALNSPDPVRAAVVALTAYHALGSHHIRNLQLTDIRDRRLHVDGRTVPLAEPARRRVAAWLDHRAHRWPNSTNPHLFIHFRTAGRDEPVGIRWVFTTIALPGSAQALRGDRILHEALATGGDARRLCDLFGLSIAQASRYIDAIAEPELPGPH